MPLTLEADVLLAAFVIGLVGLAMTEIAQYSASTSRIILLAGPLGYRFVYYIRKYYLGELDVWLLVENIVAAVVSEGITAHSVELWASASAPKAFLFLVVAVLLMGVVRVLIRDAFDELAHSDSNGTYAKFTELRLMLSSRLTL
mmetsp:Transcript_4535/g.12607  ORF Transcript_4535/g.12607 Transcript_4535/m.12607 type:complete len:144 (+) Transcript_4535:95-526(+)